MAALLDQVKKEHEITNNLIAKIKRLGVHTREGRDQLIEAKDQLLNHLKKDVEVLYPELRKTAEENPNFKGTFEEFEKEMKEISEFCAAFFKKGVAPPTYSRSARCRSLGASSQKYAEKTKFHKVLVKSIPWAAAELSFSGILKN
jgi:hypothetical protein